MAVMNTRAGPGPAAVMQAAGGNGTVSPVTNPGQPGILLPQQHQPGIGIKPGSQTPPANVLQVVKQVLLVLFLLAPSR